MHKSLAVLSLFFFCAVSGCALNTDVLPSFDGPFAYGALTKYVAIVDVEHEIQCEINDFLTDDRPLLRSDGTPILAGGVPVTVAEISNNLLQFDQPAQVTLSVQTDLSGKVTATGINLQKYGLDIIANAITLSNKVPSLQANLQGKDTIFASPVFVIPQTSEDVWGLYVYDKDHKPTLQNFQIPQFHPITNAPLNSFPAVENYIEKYLKNVAIEGKRYAKVSIAPPTGRLNGSTTYSQPEGPIIKGLGRIRATCPNDSAPDFLHKLYIKAWLTDFFARNVALEYFEPGTHPDDVPKNYYLRRTDVVDPGTLMSVACDSKLSLKTAVAITFDTSAGVNPILSPTYIIPIAGLTLDVSPAWTQTLQIDFFMHNSENGNLCDKLLARKPFGS